MTSELTEVDHDEGGGGPSEPKKKASIVREEPQGVILYPVADAAIVARIVVPLDPTQPVVEGLDVSMAPEFSTMELGKIFFQRSAAWIRWVDRRGLLDRDTTGRTVKPRRLVNQTNGIKRYNLNDIEMTARILHQNGVISHTRMQIAFQMIHLLAIGYGVIELD